MYEQVSGSHYDVPRSCDNEHHDHTYMAVNGRILITATNKMAEGGSHDDDGSHGSITDGDNAYINMESRRAVTVKNNEAYAAVYRNEPL